MIIMRLSYKRTTDHNGTWYAVTADDDTPAAYVRRNGRTWQRSANEPGHWWGSYRTRAAAAQDAVTSARQDRDRIRAYDVLGHMDLSTSFDQCSGPVDTWSDGAQWCLRLWEDAREAFDENHDADDDTAATRAESMTPIYTGNVWRIWYDLTAFSSERADETEKSSGQSATDYAMAVLYDLAQDAMQPLFNEWRAELKCDECDEYPCVCDDDTDDTDMVPAYVVLSLTAPPMPETGTDVPSDADLKWTDHDVVTADETADDAPLSGEHCDHCPADCGHVDRSNGYAPDDCGHCFDGCC